MSFNLTRAAATMTSQTALAKAASATIRCKLIHVPARIASRSQADPAPPPLALGGPMVSIVAQINRAQPTSNDLNPTIAAHRPDRRNRKRWAVQQLPPTRHQPSTPPPTKHPINPQPTPAKQPVDQDLAEADRGTHLFEDPARSAADGSYPHRALGETETERVIVELFRRGIRPVRDRRHARHDGPRR